MAAETTWVQDYYKEVQKDEREEILEKGLEEDGNTPENELRKKLWDIRYGKRKGFTDAADHFIGGLMELSFYNTQKHVSLKPKAVAKTIKKIEDDWGLPVLEAGGELEQEIFYWEFYNMMKLYISLCLHDRTYSSVLMGMGKMKKTSLHQKIAKDVHGLAYKVPQLLQIEDRLALFTKAATDAYFATFKKAESRHYLEARIAGQEE